MTRPVNDMQLKDGGWRNYDHIETNSLWLMKRNDDRKLHGFVGSNVPDIQRQLYTRYTRKNNIVLDPFLGTGTSIYVAAEMQRWSIGVDLDLGPFRQQELDRVPAGKYFAFEADSTLKETYNKALQIVQSWGREYADFLFYHPPYADMVDYGDQPGQLSAKNGVEWFLEKWAEATFYGYTVLKPGGWAAVVIADMYRDGCYVPLSHYIFQRMWDNGYIPKAEIVKDMRDNEAAVGKNAALKRLRSLRDGYFTFAHEKIFLFQKPGRYAGDYTDED